MASVSNELDDYYGSSSEGLDDDDGAFEEPSTSGAPTQTQSGSRKRRCRYTEEERRVRRRLANRESARRMRAKRSQAVNELESSVVRLSDRNKQLEQQNKEYARSLQRMRAELDALKQQVHGGQSTSAHTAGTASAGAAVAASPQRPRPHKQQQQQQLQQQQLSGDATYGVHNMLRHQPHHHHQHQIVPSISVHQYPQQQDSGFAYTSTHRALSSEVLGVHPAASAAVAGLGSSCSLHAFQHQQQRQRRCSSEGKVQHIAAKQLASTAAAAAAAAAAGPGAGSAGDMFRSDALAAAAAVAGQQQQLWLQQQWQQQLPGLAAAGADPAAAGMPLVPAIELPADHSLAAAAMAAAQQQGLMHPALLAAQQGVAGSTAELNPAVLGPTMLNPAELLAPPGGLNHSQLPSLLNPAAVAAQHQLQQQQQQGTGRQGSSGRPGSAGRPSTPGREQAPPIRFPSVISVDGNHVAGFPLVRGISNAAVSSVMRHDSAGQQQQQQQLPMAQAGGGEMAASVLAAQQQQRAALADPMSRLAMHGQLAAPAPPTTATAGGGGSTDWRKQQQQDKEPVHAAAALFARLPGNHNHHLLSDSHNHLLSLLPGSDPMLLHGRPLGNNSGDLGQLGNNGADDLIEELLRTMPDTDIPPGDDADAAADVDGSCGAQQQQQHIKQEGMDVERTLQLAPEQQQMRCHSGSSGTATGSADHHHHQQQQEQQSPAQDMSLVQTGSSPVQSAVHSAAPPAAAASAAAGSSGAAVFGSSMQASVGLLQFGGEQLIMPITTEQLQLQQPQFAHNQQQQEGIPLADEAAAAAAAVAAAATSAAAAAATLAARGSAFKTLGFGEPLTSHPVLSNPRLPAAAGAPAAAALPAARGVGQKLPAGFVPVSMVPTSPVDQTAAAPMLTSPVAAAPPAAAVMAAAALLEGPSLDPFEHWASRHNATGDKGKDMLQSLNNMLVTDVPPAPVGLYGPAGAGSSQQQKSKSRSAGAAAAAAAADHPRGRGHAHPHHGSSKQQQQEEQFWDMPAATAAGKNARKRRFPLKNPSRFSHLGKTAASDPVAAAAAAAVLQQKQRFSAGDVSLVAASNITFTACHGSSGHPGNAAAAAAASSRRRRRNGSGDGSMLGPISCISRVSAAAAPGAAAATAEEDMLSPQSVDGGDTQCNTNDDMALVPAVSEYGGGSEAVGWQQQQQQQQLQLMLPDLAPAASEPCNKVTLVSDVADGCRSFASEPVGSPAAAVIAAADPAAVAAAGRDEQQQQPGISPQLQALQLQLQQQIRRNKAFATAAPQQNWDLGLNGSPWATMAAAAAVDELPELLSTHPGLAASAAAPAAAIAATTDAAAAAAAGTATTSALTSPTAAAAAADRSLSAGSTSPPERAAAAAAEDSGMHMVPSVSQSTLLESPGRQQQQQQRQSDDHMPDQHADTMQGEGVIADMDYADRHLDDYIIPDSPPQLDALLAAMQTQEQQRQWQQQQQQLGHVRSPGDGLQGDRNGGIHETHSAPQRLTPTQQQQQQLELLHAQSLLLQQQAAAAAAALAASAPRCISSMSMQMLPPHPAAAAAAASPDQQQQQWWSYQQQMHAQAYMMQQMQHMHQMQLTAAAAAGRSGLPSGPAAPADPAGMQTYFDQQQQHHQQ